MVSLIKHNFFPFYGGKTLNGLKENCPSSRQQEIILLRGCKKIGQSQILMKRINL
jgi:hypothetical protein